MRAVTETEFVFESDLESLRFSGTESDVEMNDDLALGVAEGRLPFNDTEARLRNFSKADAVGDATVLEAVESEAPAALGELSRLFENVSSALMRFEMPEDTLTFLATSTGMGLSDWLLLSTYVADIDRVSVGSELKSLGGRPGFDTARFCQASSGVRGSPSADKGPLPTDTGWASSTVADFSSSISESSDNKFSSSEKSGACT